MPTYEPIPTPPSQRWREFRMRALPFMVFVCSLVGAVFMWRTTVNAPTLVGEVEGRQAWVTSREVGVVTNLLVDRFDRVTNGQPVAVVANTDMRSLGARVQELRSRISMSQFELGSILDRERIAFDYQDLSLSTLRLRSDLAAAKAQLPTAESAVERNQRGVKEQVISINEYEASLGIRDSLRAWIGELEKLVAESEMRLKQAAHAAAAFTNSVETASLPSTLLERMNEERREMEAARTGMTILTAPFDGVVGSILKYPGENVAEGDIIMTIHSLEGDRIIGYLRQPLPFTPKAGDPVKVRCRTLQREEAMSQIAQVSPRYEPITNLSLLRPGFTYEIGMPVSIPIPPELRPTLAPGELVDLFAISH